MTATPVITKLVDLYDVPALANGQTIVKAGGILVATDAAAPGWRPPVANAAALPMVGNGAGDIRLTLDDIVLHAWNGAAWVAVAGGGGGGGGSTLTNNLFVQQVAPDPGDFTLDSLWIPTNVDGTPKTLDTWEVYTGTGSGDGINLFVQVAAPTPVVDALWVPLNVDGTPKYIDEWVVFTGRGSQVGVGNPNLFIGQALPSAPPVGSLVIPLTAQETARSIDQWRVYA